MPDPRTISTLLLGAVLVTLNACGPGEDAETEAEAQAETAAELAEAAEATCWLRSGTIEEAEQRASPLGQTEIRFGDQVGRICWGRVQARGRVVMGELVPYGQAWRLGADEATALHLPFAVEIGDIALEPGSYSMYAIPGESEWEIVINGVVERWGIPITEEVMAENLGSVTSRVYTPESTVETLHFSWEPGAEGTGVIAMEWENTRLEIPVRGPGAM